jgi:hypothetical protein
MKRSVTSSLLAAAAVAVMAMSSAAYGVVASCVTRASRWLFEPLPLLYMPESKQAAEPMQKVPLVRAVAFRLRRLVRRERIEVQPGYRRCPAI